MFAAMHPSGAAALFCAHALDSSLPRPSVAAPVHGGSFFADVAQLVEQRFHTPRVAGSIPAISTSHSHSPKSSSHASTSAARVKQRTKSAWTAASAHSLSSIDLSSLRLSMGSFFFIPVDKT